MPDAPITTLRSTLASDLANASYYAVFAYPPQAPLANSVVIMPDEPYILVNSNQKLAIQPTARFKLLLLAPLFDNQGNLTTIETFMTQVMTKLAASTLIIHVGAFSAPGIIEQPSGNLLQTELPIEIISSWT
jgi:hypothetical protein